MNNKSLGQKGEEIAAAYLKKKGYQIKERNCRLGRGEIDLVASQNGHLIFVEVKTSQPSSAFSPLDHINVAKQRQLLKLSQLYLMKHHSPPATPYQIDLVAVVVNQQGELVQIEHLADALEDR